VPLSIPTLPVALNCPGPATRRPRCRERTLALGLTCAILSLSAARAASSEPKLIGDATVLADRKTGNATGTIYLQNDSGGDLKLSLNTIVNAAKPSELKVKVGLSEPKLAPKPEPTGDDNSSSRDYQNLAMKNGDVTPVWVIASNAYDDGDTPVDLLDGATKIGTIKIRRLPFSVKLDGPFPDKLDLSLLRDVETRIVVKNDQPIRYQLDWQLFLDGNVICSGRGVPVLPNGLGVLVCNSHTIPFKWQHLLKDETIAGKLFLAEGGKDFEPPLKTFDVTASAYAWPDGLRHSIRYLIVFVILAAGGLFSLLLNQTLPNQLQKLNIKEQLIGLARATSDLSTHLDTKLAVLVRLERAKLTEALKSRLTVFPEFATIAGQVTDGIARLNTRVKLLQQMQSIIERLEKIVPDRSPPSLVDQVNEGLGKASVLLGKADCTDPDVQAAQAALGSASTLVDSLSNPGSDFGQALAQRIQAVVADVPGIMPQHTFANLISMVPGPLADIGRAAAPNFKIPSGLMASLDAALIKLVLMRDVSTLAEGTGDQAMLTRLRNKLGDLAVYLQLGSLEALDSARLLLREMKDDIYPERIRQALDAGEAFIQMDPAVAYSDSPLTFRLSFRNKGVDQASAREEWTCNWNFGDGLTATGWEVSHYYDLRRLQERAAASQQDGKPQAPGPPKVVVVVTFQDETGHDVVKGESKDLIAITLEVPVSRTVVPKSWERTWIEGLKLSAALLIAVFGLVAGAGDQIAKLDLLPALAAIFLLGFGADTIKNVFSPKPPQS